MATTDATATTCYRHRDRETGVSCSSCGRPICTECMTATPVGMRCPECSSQTTKVRNLGSTRSAGLEVTKALIAVNVAVFLGQVLTAGGLSGAGTVYVYGVLFGPAVADGEWWRLVTSGFLHGGPFHILLNMVALWFLGQWLESEIGRGRFALIYFASLLGGSLGVMLLDPTTPALGASGAIYGLFGALLAGMRARGLSALNSPLGFMLAINLVFTFLYPNISIGAHLGGLATGFVIGWLLLDLPRRQRSRALPLGLAGVVAVACAVGAVLVANLVI